MESKESATVVSEFVVGKYTVLTMSEDLPHNGFNCLRIDGIEYAPEIVYDMGRNVIGIVSNGGFTGKVVEFVKKRA